MEIEVPTTRVVRDPKLKISLEIGEDMELYAAFTQTCQSCNGNGMLVERVKCKNCVDGVIHTPLDDIQDLQLEIGEGWTNKVLDLVRTFFKR